MILANVAAAEMLEKKALPLIYRVHDEPTLEKVHALQEFLKTLDLPFAKSGALRPSLFNRVLTLVAGQDYEQLVNEVVLRSQAQAEYSAENYGHFGLNLRRYAHYTSPIRRYADLVVHRGLIRALGLGEGALPETEYVDALIADLEFALPLIWGRRVGSVFFGGGTPSLFAAACRRLSLNLGFRFGRAFGFGLGLWLGFRCALDLG